MAHSQSPPWQFYEISYLSSIHVSLLASGRLRKILCFSLFRINSLTVIYSEFLFLCAVVYQRSFLFILLNVVYRGSMDTFHARTTSFAELFSIRENRGSFRDHFQRDRFSSLWSTIRATFFFVLFINRVLGNVNFE